MTTNEKLDAALADLVKSALPEGTEPHGGPGSSSFRNQVCTHDDLETVLLAQSDLSDATGRLLGAGLAFMAAHAEQWGMVAEDVDTFLREVFEAAVRSARPQKLFPNSVGLPERATIIERLGQATVATEVAVVALGRVLA